MTYPAAKSPAEHRLLGYGFGLTVFLSAFLLFQVQPIISKVLLPWFGGSPSVWTTCMLVFQWLLFAGYAYAHLATRRLSARGQTILHVAILVAAATLLPILPGAGWKPTSPDHPWLSVVSILLGCVGLPFFVLSTSGPLLQAWFARTFPGQSPYRLYALSNAGSLLGLITYPFVVEPWLPLARQSMDWSGLFVAYAVFCGTVSIKSVASRSREPAAPVQQFGKAKKAAPQPQPVRPTARLVALWFALGAVPSIMMLATTNQVCGDVAPAPFLWIVPLSLYLLSFILCFESTRWYRRRGYLAAFAVSGGAMAYVLGYTTVMPIAVQVTVYFSGVFLCAMLCHGELNRLKPDPEHLTFFYLVLAAAGATGGAVVSLVAPLVFHSYLEFPLAVVATFALGLGIAYRDQIAARATFRPSWDWCLVLAAALGTAGGMGYCVVQEQHNSIRSLRNFYGVLRVVETPVTRRFSHGRTLHGLQLTDSPAARRTGTTYFGPRSGIGLVLQFHNSQRARRIGVVGLGAGTLAVYAKAGDSLRFYELDPDVLRLASQYFTFLSDCPARVDTVLGDARLALEAERQQTPTQPYDVLAVDAFSGDAIPMHLLTREAVALYLGLLKDDGILAFHVSNRHFDLTPVLAAAAKSERLVSRVVIAQPTQSYERPSVWVLLCRAPQPLDTAVFSGLPTLNELRTVAWTDDFCSLAAVLQPQQIGLTRMELQTSPDAQEYKRYLDQGVAAMDRNDLNSAADLLRQALRINSRDVAGWFYLGNVMRLKGRTDDAIRCYQAAISIDASCTYAHVNLAGLLVPTDPARAEQHLRVAVQLDPRNPQAHATLGTLLARQGKFDEAIGHYEQALTLDPRMESVRKSIAAVRQAKATESLRDSKK